MISKLGPHTIRASESALVWARAAGIVKALDDTAALRQATRARVRVFRRYFPQQDFDRNGAAVVDEVLAALGDAPATHVELFNEAAQRLGQGLERHVEMTREAVARLKERRPDLTLAAFSFSTGNPEPEDWVYLKAHGYGGASCISMHEYWAAQGFSTWNALRYRRVHEWTGGQHPPFVVTECGRDRVEGGPPGWKLAGITDEQYLAELRAYDAEIAKDAYVIGAVVFTAGPTPDWEAFSTDGIEGALVAETGPLPTPPVYSPPAPAPVEPPEPPAPQPKPTPTPGGTVDTYDQWSMPKRRSTAHVENYGPLKRPKTTGVVVHSTAGVSSTLAKEFIGTINWFQNPEAGVSAHAVIGPSEVAACVPEDEVAWHARENNSTHLGLELAWPDTPAYAEVITIPSNYYEYAGELIARWAKKYGFPLRWVTSQSQPGLILHKETEAGKRDGKRDPTGRFDKDALLQAALRWQAKLGGTPVPTPPKPSPPKPDAVTDALNGLAHHLNQAEANVEQARAKMVELKKAIGR